MGKPEQLEFFSLLTNDPLCPYCNKSFKKYRPHQIYCSKTCKKGFENKKYENLNTVCLVCENIFQRTKSTITQKYCSKQCRDEFWNKRYSHAYEIKKGKRKKIIVIGVCVHCNKEYTKTVYTPYQKFCSKKCKANFAYHNSSEKIKENRKKRGMEYRSTPEYKKRRKEYQREYRIKNRKKITDFRRNWSSKNKEKIRGYYKKNAKKYKQKYHIDPQFKLKCCLQTAIIRVLFAKKAVKSKNTLELLGCSWDEAKKHLESQFKEGMTWENHGLKGWHIDHIIPCASFDLTNIEEQKKCFNYKNLQPLWWHENLSKGAKIIESKTDLQES